MPQIGITILTILLIAMVVVFVLVIGVYKLGWENRLPLPAAMVNGEFITFQEFDRYARQLGARTRGEILNSIIAEKITADYRAALTRDTKAIRRLEDVREQIEHGLEFEQAAALYSDDEPTKYIGGDLGAATSAEMPEWLRKGTAGLKENQISEVLVSPEGYHLVRRRDGHLWHIFQRAPSFADYFEQQKKNYRVYVFWKI